MAPGHQPGVDELVEGSLGELGGQLAAQVVQDQQIAVEIPPGLVPGLPQILLIPQELAVFKLGEHAARRVVHHAFPLFGDRAGNTGRQEGLAQPRRAGQKEIFEIEPPELLGIIQTDLIHQLHVFPGGYAPPGPLGLAVIIQAEGVEGLLPQIQQLG